MRAPSGRYGFRWRRFSISARPLARAAATGRLVVEDRNPPTHSTVSYTFAVTEAAERIAERIPLSHFPAKTRFLDWSTWPTPAVLPRCLSDVAGAAPADAHDQLRWAHAFLFAGPACFAANGRPAGDGVMYFGASVDGLLRGHACPFDTGSCKPSGDGGFLQPYASDDAVACMAHIQASSVSTANWREDFRAWLEHCYDQPVRYLQSDGDRWTDGEPDRTRPPVIRERNGQRGLAHGKCADRRAWTWEVRTTQRVGFEHVAAIHLWTHLVDDELLDRKAELEERVSTSIRLMPVDPALHEDGPTALYKDSGRVLRLLIDEVQS